MYILRWVVRIWILIALAVPAGVFAFSNLPWFDNNSPLTKDLNDVVDSSIVDADDPLRLGSQIAGEPLDQWQREGLIYRGIDTTQEAWKITVDVVRRVLNYALWLIGLVALLYLLYHWFLALSAWDDDSQFEKWLAWIKFALIAIAWIALAWFILSLVYRLITVLTTQ